MKLEKGFTRNLAVKCLFCGSRFFKREGGGRLPGYCSERCRKALKLERDRRANPRIGGYIPKCGYCQMAFPSRYDRAYCSRTCSSRALIVAKPPRECKTCGQAVQRPIGRGTDRAYCSPACMPKKKNAGHGYVALACPDHPLANLSGWQFEHRVVLFDAIGAGEHPCHWCGKLLTWEEHYNGEHGLGVDHLDFDRTNNDLSNLVPACRKCNCKRRRRKTATEDGGYGRKVKKRE